MPVRDLSASRTGNTVHLEWTVSDRTTDHTVAAEPIRTRICRIQGNGPCELVTEQPTSLGKGAAWDDTLPTDELQGEPQLLTYYVELQNHARKSAGRSNPAYSASGPALPVIDSPSASVITQGVSLSWQPAEWPSLAGQRFVRIVRMLAASAASRPGAPPSRLTAGTSPEPAVQTLEVAIPVDSSAESGRALDHSARFGETYSYQLQRVGRLMLDGHAVEVLGPRTEAISIMTRDVFPPAIPQQLDAVADLASHSIDLSWSPDNEPDLAGYFVYREDPAGKSGREKAQKISGPEPISAPSFRDSTVQPGLTYAYFVTAVDRNGNESQPSDEADESIASQPQR